MANLPALVLDVTAGGQRQITTADTLFVGGGIDRQTAGALTVGGTTATSVSIAAAAVTTTVAGPLSQTTGQVTLNGNVDATAGLDVTGSAMTMTGSNIDLDPTGTFSLDMDAGQTATFTVADNLANAFRVQEGSNAYLAVSTSNGSEVVAFGNTSTNPDYNFLGTGQSTFSGGVVIAGNLDVQGTQTAVNSANVNVSDNHLYLNDGYATAAAQTGGLVVNYLPTATNDTVASGGFTAGVASSSDATVITTGSATFAAGDFIQIVGANTLSNTGLFEVKSHSGTTLAIRGVGAGGSDERTAPNDWTQTNFTTDATVAGTIRKVTLSILRAGTDGIWETASGASTTGLVFADLSTGGGGTLQSAYVGGNTITTSAGEGNVVIGGTETLDVNIAADFSVGVTVSGGALVHTGTAIDLDPTGTFTLDMDAGQAATITVASNLANAFRVKEGSNAYIDVTTVTESEAVTVGNASNNPKFIFLGVGEWQFDGTAGQAGQALVSNGADLNPTWQAPWAVGSGDWDTDTNTVAAGDVAAYTTTANEATQADATAASGAQTVIGICALQDAATGVIIRSGRYNGARFAASLTLNPSDRCFVSKTAGALTNDVSGFTTGDVVIPVGYIRDTLSYDGTADFLVDIEIDIGEPVTVA